jgi:hypothetical protein
MAWAFSTNHFPAFAFIFLFFEKKNKKDIGSIGAKNPNPLNQKNKPTN